MNYAQKMELSRHDYWSGSQAAAHYDSFHRLIMFMFSTAF